MQDRHINDIAKLLKTMSHPIRLKILCLLQDREMTVGDIRKEVRTTSANVCQHLSILRHQGIITCRRDANCIYNRIAEGQVAELNAAMRELFCETE